MKLHEQDHDWEDDCDCDDPSCVGCDAWDDPDVCQDCRAAYCPGDCQECAFPGACCMPGEHVRAECFTAEMAEQWERDAEEAGG